MVAKYTGFCRGCCGTTRNTYFEERSELSQQLSCHLWPIWTWASFARREPWGWTVARWCWGSSWWCFLGVRELKDVFEVEELRSFCNLFLWTGDCSELNKIRRNSKKKLINPSVYRAAYRYVRSCVFRQSGRRNASHVEASLLCAAASIEIYNSYDQTTS